MVADEFIFCEDKKMSNGLITINFNNNERPTVLGRDLHNFLEVTERYSSWFERMLQYGFAEGIDFAGCKTFNTQARQELQNHQLTLEMAKEIAMIQRTEKGKQARLYFLECEKRLKQELQPMSEAELILKQSQLLVDHNRKLKEIELQQKQQQQQLAEVSTTIDSIMDAVSMPTDNWRKDITAKINKLVDKTTGDHKQVRNDLYKQLETKAGCNLSKRLDNAHYRLFSQGKSKTEINKITKLDVIEGDKHLKEIFTTIVKEMYIKHCV